MYIWMLIFNQGSSIRVSFSKFSWRHWSWGFFHTVEVGYPSSSPKAQSEILLLVMGKFINNDDNIKLTLSAYHVPATVLSTLTPLNDDSLYSILEEAWEDDEQIERQQDLGGKLHPAPVKYRLRKKAVNIRKLEKYFLWSQTLYLLRQHLFQLNLERVWNTI